MKVETYTQANGSNMDCIDFATNNLEEIAEWLIEHITGWDYAYVSDDDGESVGTIWNAGKGFTITN